MVLPPFLPPQIIIGKDHLYVKKIHLFDLDLPPPLPQDEEPSPSHYNVILLMAFKNLYEIGRIFRSQATDHHIY